MGTLPGDIPWNRPTLVRTRDVVANLANLVIKTREHRGLSLRQAAAEIGIAHSNLDRLERGGSIGLECARKVLAWLAS